ncbi:hypothetical protein [Rhodococcus pyridinivorans]|uniref:hypothetical protein n=1 Tax=Rhodococcus pyridinivorans TaxID=103816 RepID=UPI0020790D79|nr:hypothetical protein [Rhodococcus pyridinivorans]USI88769.1 hypothetical protein LLA01_14205 [Rhodococcus pyridinivorans]
MNAPHENAPDAGQGIEGKESNPQETGDSDLNTTRPTAAEIAEAGHAVGYSNVTHALVVCMELQCTPSCDRSREEWLELAVRRLAELEVTR